MISVDEVTGGLLPAAVAAGFVREQRHPTLPLRVFNYSERVVYERALGPPPAPRRRRRRSGPRRHRASRAGAPPRRHAEGLVVHAPRLDERVKLEQADYVTLLAKVMDKPLPNEGVPGTRARRLSHQSVHR